MFSSEPVSHVALSDFEIVNEFSHTLADMSLGFRKNYARHEVFQFSISLEKFPINF